MQQGNKKKNYFALKKFLHSHFTQLKSTLVCITRFYYSGMLI